MKRANSSTFAAEVGSVETGSLTFTVSSTANATFKVSSTGSANFSDFILKDGEGNGVTPKGATEALVVVTGTNATEIKYEGLTAGTYAPARYRFLRMY